MGKRSCLEPCALQARSLEENKPFKENSIAHHKNIKNEVFRGFPAFLIFLGPANS